MKLNRYTLATLGLLAMSNAHAASFNCAIAHSTAETLICHDAGLSRADDELGKLFRLAQKQAADRRAYRRASDSKWTWREENCKDIACLADWYSTRIAEIREQLHNPASGDERTRPVDADLAAAGKPGDKPGDKPSAVARDVQQCTATTQDLVPPVRCSSVLERRTQWQTREPASASDSWFCGVAMIESPSAEFGAAQ